MVSKRFFNAFILNENKLNTTIKHRTLNRKVSYSSDAIDELYEIYNYTITALDIAIESYANKDVKKAESIDAVESRIDDAQKKFRERHIKRLYDGKCTAYSGAIFLDLISNFERIGDHATNIAEWVMFSMKSSE